MNQQVENYFEIEKKVLLSIDKELEEITKLPSVYRKKFLIGATLGFVLFVCTIFVINSYSLWIGLILLFIVFILMIYGFYYAAEGNFTAVKIRNLKGAKEEGFDLLHEALEQPNKFGIYLRNFNTSRNSPSAYIGSDWVDPVVMTDSFEESFGKKIGSKLRIIKFDNYNDVTDHVFERLCLVGFSGWFDIFRIIAKGSRLVILDIDDEEQSILEEISFLKEHGLMNKVVLNCSKKMKSDLDLEPGWFLNDSNWDDWDLLIEDITHKLELV